MTERTVLEDMEKELITDRYGIDYEGVFDYDGLIRMIEEWCRNNDYYCELESKKEKVTAEARNISVGYTVYRKFHNKFYSVIIFDVDADDMKDVEHEVDGKMKNLNEGKVSLIFHSYFMTSQKARWETKGYAYFLRGVVDKLIYKIDKPAYRGIVSSDTSKLINEIKGFLNIYSHLSDSEAPKGRLKGGWV
ncbi:hypothetical protein GF345_00685 [Candidatus Woesearchaeota archaeon]|nr:hypothetical protein [Candidatus Woesearchaeota archaeon]